MIFHQCVYLLGHTFYLIITNSNASLTVQALPRYRVLMRNFHAIEYETFRSAFFAKANPVEKLAAKKQWPVKKAKDSTYCKRTLDQFIIRDAIVKSWELLA